MGQTWYLALENNEQKGPMSEDEVRAMIAARQAHSETLCWTAEFTDWVPLRDVPDFAPDLAAAAPPPAPAPPPDVAVAPPAFAAGPPSAPPSAPSPAAVSPPPPAKPASAMLDEGLKGLRDLFDKGKRGAIQKVNAAKVKLRISKVQSARTELCAKLGAAVFSVRGELVLNESLQAQVEQVAKCDEELAQLQAELAQIEAPGN